MRRRVEMWMRNSVFCHTLAACCQLMCYVALSRTARNDQNSENCSLLRYIDFDSNATRIGFVEGQAVNGWRLTRNDEGFALGITMMENGEFQLPPQGPPRGPGTCSLSFRYRCPRGCRAALHIRQMPVVTGDDISSQTVTLDAPTANDMSWRDAMVTLRNDTSFQVTIEKESSVSGSAVENQQNLIQLDNLVFSEECCPGWLQCAGFQWRTFDSQPNVTSWEHAERECRRHGGHLGLHGVVPYPAVDDACYNKVTTVARGEVYIGAQSQFDGNFRWAGGNNMIVDVGPADIGGENENTTMACSVWSQEEGGNSSARSAPCVSQSPLPYLCVRNVTQNANPVNVANCTGEGSLLTYIPIAFGYQDAAEQCDAIEATLIDIRDVRFLNNCATHLVAALGSDVTALPSFALSSQSQDGSGDDHCSLISLPSPQVAEENCSEPHPAICLGEHSPPSTASTAPSVNPTTTAPQTKLSTTTSTSMTTETTSETVSADTEVVTSGGETSDTTTCCAEPPTTASSAGARISAIASGATAIVVILLLIAVTIVVYRSKRSTLRRSKSGRSIIFTNKATTPSWYGPENETNNVHTTSTFSSGDSNFERSHVPSPNLTPPSAMPVLPHSDNLPQYAEVCDRQPGLDASYMEIPARNESAPRSLTTSGWPDQSGYLVPGIHIRNQPVQTVSSSLESTIPRTPKAAPRGEEPPVYSLVSELSALQQPSANRKRPIPTPRSASLTSIPTSLTRKTIGNGLPRSNSTSDESPSKIPAAFAPRADPTYRIPEATPTVKPRKTPRKSEESDQGVTSTTVAAAP